MQDNAGHPARVADQALLHEIRAACDWWETQHIWQVSSSATGGGSIAALEDSVVGRVAPGAVALALPSGTAALTTALRTVVSAAPSYGIGVPALDWTASRAVTRSLGFSTVALPVSPDTGLLDTHRLARDPEITQGLAAVVVVHLHGLACDVPTLRRALPSLPVVEDAAQAWAARYPDGTPVGSAADFCAFSFGPAKSPSAGELGCLVTRTPGLLQAAVALTQHPVRQLLTGITRPRQDQAMARVAPVAALLGAYAIHRHSTQEAALRQAATHLAATLRHADLHVLTNPELHSPGTIAVRAVPDQVQNALRGTTLGGGITITSIDGADLHVHPDAQDRQQLRELAATLTVITMAASTGGSPQAPNAFHDRVVRH
jgi:hypothetical protein